MTKKLLTIGGLLVVLLVLIGLVLALTGSNGTLCDGFINDVRNNQPSKAYELYSPTVQGQLTSTNWNTEVANLSTAYGKGGTLSLIDSSQAVNQSGTTTQNTYKLETTTGSYNLTCITLDINKEHAVDAFSSAKN